MTPDRRSFLKAAASLSAAAVLAPEALLADPYRPLAPARPRATPVRVRGRVSSRGRGLGGVRVTDGLTVARTDPDGRYELVTSTTRGFVSVSVPRGFRIERSATGTARLHRRLTPDGRSEMDVPFELDPLSIEDDEHAMLLLADVQTETRWEMDRFHEQTVPDVVDTLRNLGETHTFGIACGDIMFDDLSLYPEYERGVRRMGVPFFQVVGNHDLDLDGEVDEESTRTFSRHFGPRYYSFDRGAVRYVVLDDVFHHGAGYVGYVDQDQLRWLEADLADVEPGSPVVVALHIPVLGTRHVREGEERPGTGVSVNNREALYRLLEPFQAHVLSGHTHENDHHHAGGVHEHVSGTVCGAWWSGPICGDGTPNGYGVYEVRGEEITWRYKSTGRAPEHQMRAYLPGADPAAPSRLIANVWDADEGWEVVWYEGGERRGRMTRRVGIDPVSRLIHGGDQRPPRRPWVDPYPRYVYSADIEPTTAEIRVEARDRFGRRYVAIAGDVPRDLTAWPAG